MDQAKQKYELPLGIVSRVDIGRLLREIDALNTFMKSAEVRVPGTQPQLPKTSKLLDEFLEINKKSALKPDDREEVQHYLSELREQAPTIHMSFSADPSPLFTERLVSWLRQNIHPSLLLQVGLQPTIGAGVLVRTTNKFFDFSLREYFADKKPVLLAKMRAAESNAESDSATQNVPTQNQDEAAPTTQATQLAVENESIKASEESAESVTKVEESKSVADEAPKEAKDETSSALDATNDQNTTSEASQPSQTTEPELAEPVSAESTPDPIATPPEVAVAATEIEPEAAQQTPPEAVVTEEPQQSAPQPVQAEKATESLVEPSIDTRSPQEILDSNTRADAENNQQGQQS